MKGNLKSKVATATAYVLTLHAGFGAGVTIFTHGFGQNEELQWVVEMSGAACNRAVQDTPGAYCNFGRIRVYKDALRQIQVEVTSWGANLNNSPIAEVLLIIDWSDIDALGPERTSTRAVASAALPYVLQTIDSGDTPPLAELPIHLIGHSRGASLMTELAALLGRHGIWIDQATFLDPHPVDGVCEPFGDYDWGDAPMRVWENIRFADNYWRTDANCSNFDFDGEFVSGAHQGSLNGIVMYTHEPFQDPSPLAHSQVHTYYHGTIDLGRNDAVDGIPIQFSWYNTLASPSRPARDRTGFYFSRLGKGPRPYDGLKTSSAYRAPLDPLVVSGANVWDNIEISGISGGPTIVRGDFLTAHVRYQDRNGDSTIVVGYDRDRNPYNGTTGTLPQLSAPPTGEGLITQTWSTSPMEPGNYYFYAKIYNSVHTRFYYFPHAVDIVPPPAPVLDSPSLTPETGTTTQTYTYQVHYFDSSGLIPLGAKVYIDGLPFTMTRVSGTDANGTYRYTKGNFTTGAHAYYFLFRSGGGIEVRLPEVGTFSGPTVSSTGGGSDATNYVHVRWGMFAGAGDTDYREAVGGEVFPIIGSTTRFALGDELWFTGTPSFGWELDRWQQRWASPEWVPVNTVSGNSAMIRVNGDGHTIRCIFRRQNPSQRILKITVVGPGQANPRSGAYSYPHNGQATVTATPNPDARFVGWTLDGADAGFDSMITVTMDGVLDKDLRATFAWNSLAEFTVDLPCIADVSVSASDPRDSWNAYYNQPEIPVRFRSDPPIYEAFFKFDVSTLPADAVVSNVALHAYCRGAPTSWAAVEVQKNTGDWSDTVQMTSLPGRTSTSWPDQRRGVGWHVFDLSGVTTQWRDWVQQEWMRGQNFGLRIRPYQPFMDQQLYMNGTFNYYTREHGVSNERPFVRITYLGRRLVPTIATDKPQIVVQTPKGQVPTNEVLLIRNSGEGILHYAVSNDAPWLILSGATTGTSTNENQQLVLGFDTANLAGGVYQATVTITDTNASNSPLIVPVLLTILGPAISVSTTNIWVTAVQGENPTSTTLEVWNSGHGTLEFSILTSAAWLNATPPSGMSTGEVQQIAVQFATAALNPGTYQETITVTNTTGEADPVHVPVMLTIWAKVAAPTFTPQGNAAYLANVAVSIYCATPGAIIRYTVDGSSPSESSPQYAGDPILITSTAVLRAKAWKDGMLPSLEQVSTYTIIPPPVLSISRQGINLLLSWPTNATEFDLEYSPNLPATDWIPVMPARSVVDDQFVVTNLISDTNGFFRLKRD